jgi:hypothetical protein
LASYRALLLRVRVAVRALIVAIEAAAYAALDGSRDTPSACIRLSDEVPQRIAACREHLDGGPRASTFEHRRQLARVRASLERLDHAYLGFPRAEDKSAAALALLEVTSDVQLDAESWV